MDRGRQVGIDRQRFRQQQEQQESGPVLPPQVFKDDFEVDPDTFLFEDDDEDEDLSDLPPERESSDDSEDDFGFDDDDDW